MPTLPALRSDRVDELIRNFTQYHVGFTSYPDLITLEGGVTDPYFEILSLCRTHGSALRATRDDQFYFLLLKTLKAWKMNRGRRGGSLLSDREIRVSFHSPDIQEAISAVERLSLTDPAVIEPANFQPLKKLMWGIAVTRAKSKLVANSKTLHFLMPKLVPPIDRRYTQRFFFDRDVSPDLQREAFDTIFGRFHYIALSASKHIGNLVGSSRFAVSEAKVIDNAIIGFCRTTKLTL